MQGQRCTLNFIKTMISLITCFMETIFICELLQGKSCTKGYQTFGTLVRAQKTRGQLRRKHRDGTSTAIGADAAAAVMDTKY